MYHDAALRMTAPCATHLIAARHRQVLSCVVHHDMLERATGEGDTYARDAQYSEQSALLSGCAGDVSCCLPTHWLESSKIEDSYVQTWGFAGD